MIILHFHHPQKKVVRKIDGHLEEHPIREIMPKNKIKYEQTQINNQNDNETTFLEFYDNNLDT